MPKKLLLVILSAILMPVVASAQSFLVDYFPIKVYGDVETYKFVFNAVASIFQNKTIMDFVTNVVGIIAFLAIVWRIVFKHGTAGGGETGTPAWELFLKQFVFLCIIMFVFLNPAFKSTVTIEDQRFYYAAQTGGTASKARVDNIPTALAFVASASSYLGYALVSLADTAYASINGARYTDIGFLNNFNQLQEDRVIRFQSGPEKEFTRRLEKYIQKCLLVFENINGTVLEELEMGNLSFADMSIEKINKKYGTGTTANNNIKLYVDGVNCNDYYGQLEKDIGPFLKQFESKAVKAMGFQNAATAAPALMAMGKSILAAPTNVATAQSNLSPFIQFKLRQSLSESVANAAYADSLGVDGAFGMGINQQVKEALSKYTDTVNQSKWMFSVSSFPQVIHFTIAIVYAIFPFVLVVAAVRGYPEGLKMVYYYAGGLLSFELIRMSMAIVHGLVTEYTSKNAAAVLTGTQAGNVDFNLIPHGTAYYQYMASQAEFATTMASLCVLIIPVIIATGQVKLLNSAIGSAAAAPQMGGHQSAMNEMAKSDDAGNKGLESTAAGYASASVMKGIEENNAAIAALSKMDNFNDYNKGQVAQQMQQIGSTAGFGGEFKNARDFRMAELGGQFQGIQAAAQAKSLGEAMDMVHNFRDKMTDGAALARTLGNDAAAKTIGSARGLLAGDFFDRDGNLKGGREGNIYTQGLENQARISANQTAGVGKLGEFTREQMNAIQYGAQAGALNQIAQGRSLQRVHGTGEAFNQSYDAMAETQADMQNIQAKETARSAREHFKGIGTSSAEGSAYSRVSRLQADQRFEEMQGSTDAYETARGVNPNIAREQANLSATSNFKSTQAKLDNINPFDHKDAIDKLSSATANEAGEKAFQSNAGFQEKVKQGAANSDGSMTNSEYKTGMEAQTRFDTGQAITNMKNARENIKNSLAEQENKTLAEKKENYKDNVGGLGDEILWRAENVFVNAWDAATGNSSRITARWNEHTSKQINENMRLNMANNSAHFAHEFAKSGDFGSAGALTGVQNYTLGTAGTTGTFNASGGFVQGGTQSGVSLSHNTQHSYSSGITASGGSLFAASATQMGFSADGFAAGASALSAVTQTAAFMAGPVGRGSMAAASALSSAASSGASATISRLNTMDRASRDFAHNQLASIGHIGMEGDMMRFSSALSQGRVLAQERSQGANGLMKRNKQGGLVISANKASGMGKAF